MRNLLANMCAGIAALLVEAERRLRVCPDCGRSRYYGKPCK